MQKYILFVRFNLETKECFQLDALRQIARILKFYGGKIEFNLNYGIQEYHGVSSHTWRLDFVANKRGTRQLLRMLLASKDVGYIIAREAV